MISARRGRPRSETAAAHATILDAVHELLLAKSVRDLTMEEIAKHAKVGKPTLYKWWPSKAALVLATFNERLAGKQDLTGAATTEAAIRARVRHTIREFNGLLGRVMADLITEGQSEPDVLRELYDEHVKPRRARLAVEIERAKASGEFCSDVDAELLIDEIFGAIYFRLLVRHAPLTEAFGEALVDQALRRTRA